MNEANVLKVIRPIRGPNRFFIKLQRLNISISIVIRCVLDLNTCYTDHYHVPFYYGYVDFLYQIIICLKNGIRQIFFTILSML